MEVFDADWLLLKGIGYLINSRPKLTKFLNFRDSGLASGNVLVQRWQLATHNSHTISRLQAAAFNVTDAPNSIASPIDSTLPELSTKVLKH